MPKIESVSVCVVRIPLDNVIHFATRTVSAREFCLVRVRSTSGDEGIGWGGVINGCELIGLAVKDLFGPMLIGQESLRVEGLWREMYDAALIVGRTGAVMRALSVVDVALWDLNARSVGLPLYQFLGANVTDRVPAYASGGYYWPGKTYEKLADEVRGFVNKGFDAVKIKIGRLSPAEEERRVAAAREAAGPDVHLMLDANYAWKDLKTAMCYMERIEAYNPYWIEEPFSPDDIENHARLAKKIRVMVVTGELESGRWRFKELLDRGAAGLLQPDATVCGGITEWRRIAATAASYCVPVAPHARHEIHMHLVASTPNATYAEFFHDNTVTNFQCLIDRQSVCEKGHLLLPSGPGLDCNFVSEATSRFGIKLQGETDCWAIVR